MPVNLNAPALHPSGRLTAAELQHWQRTRALPPVEPGAVVTDDDAEAMLSADDVALWRRRGGYVPAAEACTDIDSGTTGRRRDTWLGRAWLWLRRLG